MTRDLFGHRSESKLDRLIRLYRAHPRKYERRPKAERTRLIEAENKGRRRGA